LEEFRYDERGQPLSVTFADYLIPTARDIPAVDAWILEDAKSRWNPLGIKGAGEGGIAGVGAVLASAVEDAIGIPGVITELPMTPQSLKRILDGAGQPRWGLPGEDDRRLSTRS
jgi:carbon-monoxide dehydrogenase large subunit/6-hydroxypseudooxynicotine dehydrogenase subunit gamma